MAAAGRPVQPLRPAHHCSGGGTDGCCSPSVPTPAARRGLDELQAQLPLPLGPLHLGVAAPPASPTLDNLLRAAAAEPGATMGVLFSCPTDDYDPLDMEEAPPAGTSGGGGAVLKALGSGKLLIEGSLSFKRAQAASGALHVEAEISIRAGDAALPREVARARFAEPAAVESPRLEATALRLQKVYKSFRTRRQLADCVVLVEQSWCVWLPPRFFSGRLGYSQRG